MGKKVPKRSRSKKKPKYVSETECSTDGDMEEKEKVEASTLDIELHQCDQCNKIMKSKYALKQHMISHAEKEFICAECNMRFASKYLLQRHNMCKHMDMSLRPCPCHLCDKRFFNKSHLAAHIKTHTKERDVSCGLCSQMFYSKADLVRHMQGRHLNIRAFTCHICQKGFFRKSYLKLHILEVHMKKGQSENGTERFYACRYCKKVFHSRTTCYSHERTHNDRYDSTEQRSLCTVCGKTFSRPSSLKKHMEKHTGPPSLKCEYCDRAFYHLSSYKRHLNIHNRPDPDICQVCGKVFTNKDAFRRHLRKHVNRGEMDPMEFEKEPSRTAQIQEMLASGILGDLDKRLEIIEMGSTKKTISSVQTKDEQMRSVEELLELGSRKDPYITARTNAFVEQMMLQGDKSKWILQYDEINGMMPDYFYPKPSSFIVESSLSSYRLTQSAMQALIHKHDKAYTVISRDFKSVVKHRPLTVLGPHCMSYALSEGFSSHVGRNPLVHKLFIVKTSPLIRIKTCVDLMSSVYTHHPNTHGVDYPKTYLHSSQNHTVSELHPGHFPPFTPIPGVDIPLYDEEIPEIKPNYHHRSMQRNNYRMLGDMYELYDPNMQENMSYPHQSHHAYPYPDFTPFRSVLTIDINLNVFQIRHLLDKNLCEMLIPLQIIPKKPKEDIAMILEEYDFTTHSKLQQFLCVGNNQAKRYCDFSTFKTAKSSIKWTGEEITRVIKEMAKKNSKGIKLRQLDDLMGDSEQKLKSEVAVKEEVQPYNDQYEDENDDGTYSDTGGCDDPNYYPSDGDNEDDKSLLRDQIDQEDQEEKLFCEPTVEDIKPEIDKEEYFSESEPESKKIKTKKKKKKKLKKERKTKNKKSKKKMAKNKADKVSLISTESVCFYCDKICSTKGTLRTHIANMHLVDRSFHCDICGWSFIAKSRLEAHVEYVHLKIRNYQCSSCEWSFYAKADLDRHERRHTGVKPFMCHLCSKTFVRKAQLKAHIAIHSGERNFMCNACGKSFTTRSTLVTHLKRHSSKPSVRYYNTGGDKSERVKKESNELFQCNICGRELSTPHSLKRHIKIVHENINKKQKLLVQKAFPCPLCPLSFTHKTSMQRHMHRIHKRYKEPRNFSCPVCSRKLLNETSVLKHMVKRHPYNCDDLEAMNAAINKASQRNIPCPLCKRKFLKEAGLHKHMVRKHYYGEDFDMMGVSPVPPPHVNEMYNMCPPLEQKTDLLML